MADLSAGNQSTYPSSLDTYDTPLVDNTNVARADVPNAIAGAIVNIENELGTNPAGTQNTLADFLDQEHGADGTHSTIESLTVSSSVTFAGNGWPSVSAYCSGVTSVDTGTPTLVELDTTVFDTPDVAAFNGSAGQHLWLPLQAGKYLITAQIRLSSLGAGKKVTIDVRQNTLVKHEATFYNDHASTAHDVDAMISVILDLDGSLDEVQIYATHDHGSSLNVDNDQTATWLMGSRIA